MKISLTVFVELAGQVLGGLGGHLAVVVLDRLPCGLVNLPLVALTVHPTGRSDLGLGGERAACNHQLYSCISVCVCVCVV